MATWAGAAHAAPRPRVEPRVRTAPRTRPATPRLRVAGGVLWIALFALLLTGIVAMNVAVLRLNMSLDKRTRDRAQIRGENAALQSRLSSSAAAPVIQSLARRKLGLEPASPDATTWVELGPR
jgi:cell division protein FtsL